MKNSPQCNSRLVKRTGQILILGGVLTLVIAGPLQPRVEAMRSENGIHIPNANYQFTPQEIEAQGKTLSHTFTLYNGRGQPLQIETQADCGCTGLSWQSVTLPPFGRKEIMAKMNSSNRSQSVGITFKTENHNYAFAQLKLKINETLHNP